MIWNRTELEGLWATVNTGNGNPHLMAAIALAESGGNDQIENSIGACGLWQIHPAQPGCKNPYTNARQAGVKLRTQGLGAWEAYTNGSYQQFLSPTAAGRTNAAFGIPFTPEIPGENLPEELLEGKTPNPLSGIEQGIHGVEKGFEALGLLEKIFKLLTTKDGWVRIGKVGVGLLLILTGVLGMAKIETQPPDVVAAKGVSRTKRAVETGKTAAELAALAA